MQNVPKVTQISRAATSTTAAATEAFTYDSNGYLASKTDWNGNETTYTNNSYGLPTQINEAVGSSVARTTTIVYDARWVHQPDSITTPGLTTSFTYDSSGDVLTKTLTDTTTTTTPYSTNGQARTWTNTWSNHLLASEKTPNGNTTTYGYSSSGALTSITDAMSHVTNITANSGGGYPETIVDPNSVTTTLVYSPRQWLTSSTVSGTDGTFATTYTYDAAGNLTKTTLPDGSYIAKTYDAAHRVTKLTDALGAYTAYTLDALGDRTQENIYDSGNTLWKQHSRTFDALGRMLTDVGGLGQTTTYIYDTNGNVISTKDGNNNLLLKSYDALNRVYKTTNANDSVAQYGYDAHDQLVAVNDYNGDYTSYVRDGFEDVIQQTSPDTGTTVYHFDSDGNLTQKTDAAGNVMNAQYDALDRTIDQTYPADSTKDVWIAYDQTGDNHGSGIGRPTSIADAAGCCYALGYDERGNIHFAQRTIGSGYATVYANYDGAGRPNAISYPSGLYLGWTRDAAGNIDQVNIIPPGSSSAQTVAWIAHDAFYGPVHYIDAGNNVADALWLDLDYRQTASQVFGTSGNFTYKSFTYDNNNNLTGISDSVNAANSQTLGYDVLNRLTSAVSGTGGYGTLAFGYDSNSNLTSRTAGGTTYSYTYTPYTNRLAGVTWTGNTETLGYTATGNISSMTLNGTATFTGTYNVANRLASVSNTSTAISSLIYDSFGQRASKTDSGGSPINYTYDLNGNLLEESGPAGVTDYIYADGVLLGIWNPSTSTLYYVTPDRLGSPQLVTNSSQGVVWNVQYQPYGAANVTTSTVTQNVRLPGQYYDTETTLNYNMMRDYIPNYGRYLEADPIGLSGGLNSYAYANANPMTVTDTLGLRGLTEGEKAIVRSMFGNGIDANAVNIESKKAFFFQPDGTDMTPNNTMYVPSGAPDDYSKSDLGQQCHFVHEMTHIYQSQNGTNLFLHRLISGKYNYSLDSGKQFSDYGVEQQAVIMSDYYALRNGASPVLHQFADGSYYGNTDVGPPYIGQYQGVISSRK